LSVPAPRIAEGEFGRIEYFELGHGPAIMALHASGAGAPTLLPLAETWAARGHRVVIPAFDGYGGTQVSAGDDAIERHCTVLMTMLARETEPAKLFGHSMGGLVALIAAARGHAGIASIAAVEPVAIGVLREHAEDAPALAPDDAAVARIAPAMAEGRHEDAIRDFISLWNGQPWAEIPERMRTAILRQAPQIHADTASGALKHVHAGFYAMIDVPVTLIETEHGPETAKAVIRRLREVLPQARQERIAGVGHMGPVTQPALFAHLV
jgi:pimeloyl-ACP methyl ester carboxylesterase